jgi:protein O-mannosyl-transferase
VLHFTQKFLLLHFEKSKRMAKQKKPKSQGPSTPVIPDSTIDVGSNRLLLLGVLAITFLVFANTLGAGFVNWDDHGYLWLNPLVQPFSGKAITDAFSGHTCGNYSPLVALTYCIEHGFDRIVKPGEQVVENFQPFLYHLNNVLLHLATTALAFVFFRQLGLKGLALAFGALLFGIHPMRVESVAWVTERKDVLYGVFYLAALISYWKYLTLPAKKTHYYLLTLGLGLIALFSKIQAVSLPLSMLCLDYLAGRDLKNIKTWLEKAPFFALSLVFGLVGLHFLEVAEGLKDTGYPISERIFFALWSLQTYLQKLILPLGLSAYYPYPKTGALPPYYYAAPLVLAGLASLLWKSKEKSRVYVFGAMFFLVNVMFVLQFKGAGKAFMADRFTYIPYLGLFFMMAKYFQDKTETNPGGSTKSTLFWVLAAYCALLAFLTFRQNQTWQDSPALWKNVTEKHPQDALSWTNLGLAYFDLGQHDQSIPAYEQALKVDPNYYDAGINLGVSHHRLKRYPEAVEAFGKAIKANPNRPEAYFARAQSSFSVQNYAQAISDYEKARQMGDKHPPHEIDLNIGQCYANLNQNERALAAYDAALKIAPQVASIHYQKGNAYAAAGNMPQAIACYDNVLKIDPKYTDAINNKGNALAAMNRFSEALPVFDQAVAVQPGTANVYFNRGMVKNSLGDKAGACKDWQRAVELGFSQAQALLQQNCR